MITASLALPSFVLTACSLASPAPQPAATEAPARPVHVEVDVSALGSDGTGVDGLVLETLTPRLEAAGYTLATTAAQAAQAVSLRVRFEVLRLDRFDYGLHFEFVEVDTVEPATAWVACLGCMDAKLLPLLDEHTPALLEALDQRAPAATESESAAANAGTGPGGEPSTDTPEPAQPARIGPLGYTGIAVGTLGLGAAIGGAVELSRGQVVQPGGSGYAREGVDHRPVGIALVSVGVVATVAGVAMLAADLGRRAQQRRRADGRSALVIPVPSRAGVSLGLVGRF